MRDLFTSIGGLADVRKPFAPVNRPALASRPDRVYRDGKPVPFGRETAEPVKVQSPEDIERRTRDVIEVDGTTYRVMRPGIAPGASEMHRKKGHAIGGPTAPGMDAMAGYGTPVSPKPGALEVEAAAKHVARDVPTTRKSLNMNPSAEPNVGKVYRQTAKGYARG